MKRDLVWLAHGLNSELTGIERTIVSFAHECSAVLDIADRLVTVVDAGTEWAKELPTGVEVVEVARGGPKPQLWKTHGEWDSLLREARLIHSYGPSLPHSDRALKVYSLYDWGPFLRHPLPLRARIAWGGAIVSGCVRADIVHSLSEATLSSAPSFAKSPIRRKKTIISIPFPRTRIPNNPSQRHATAPYLLFVGTDVPRKRIADLVNAVEACPGLRMILAGAGTEAYDNPPNVLGLGRVSETQLHELYADAAALVLLSDMEGLGLPVLEAAASGLRSVVSPSVAAVQPPYLLPYMKIADLDGPRTALEAALWEAQRGSTLPPLQMPRDNPLWDCYHQWLGT